jgi:hypothetical protein
MGAPRHVKQVPASPRVCEVTPPHTLSRSPALNVHPDFTTPDADVVLRSEEGTLFFIHSCILRNASGLFSTMFTLPQPFDDNPNRPAEIPIYESDATTIPLLRLLCGLPITPWQSYDVAERVLYLAEKWDTPGPIAYIREVLVEQRFLESDPLRLYVLAMHFEWKEEARRAATLTLGLDLQDKRYNETLDRLTTKELIPLLTLRRRRKELFRELLNSPERFTAGNR